MQSRIFHFYICLYFQLVIYFLCFASYIIQVYAELDAIGADKAEAKARRILSVIILVYCYGHIYCPLLVANIEKISVLFLLVH